MGKGRAKEEEQFRTKEKEALLRGYYDALFAHFGEQRWWPARTRFEIIVGAILTQNTNWKNVERAIRNLKSAALLTPVKMRSAKIDILAKAIRPAGYFNVKARKLKNFLDLLFGSFGGSLTGLLNIEHAELRATLLAINGIGPETADSIILYAAGKPAFVVDAYTRRILTRHKIVATGIDYHELQRLFTENLAPDARLFNEYHALIVMTGKDFCKTKVPLCEKCPLGGYL